MQGFSLNGADPSKGFNRNKLTALGPHLCEVINIRMQEGFHGLRFNLDLKVIEAPAGAPYGAGYEYSHLVMPNNAKTVANLSPAQIRAKELGKIQRSVAAVFGFGVEDAAQVDDQVFQASIATETRPSVLKGRTVIANVIPHTNKQGKASTFVEIEPDPNAPEVDLAAVLASQPAPAAPKAPPAPKPRSVPKAPVVVFPPAGWTLHPEKDDEGNSYYFKGEEVLSEADLRARG